MDYRLERPELLPWFFHDRVSKVTHRQSARIHACSRSTEERHFGRLREHCKAFHDKQMALMAARGGLGEVFLFDEQETFEHSRLKKPVTVPTDMKKTYGVLLRRLFGERCRHLRTISTLKRDTRNPLWHINHTLARTRDGVSRLVRRELGGLQAPPTARRPSIPLDLLPQLRARQDQPRT
ncbi:MAG: hypothetical protein IPK67_03080 [Planctomycetes bacterium]|nr:hypothetical protein [Planctomycetota bacterium]